MTHNSTVSRWKCIFKVLEALFNENSHTSKKKWSILINPTRAESIWKYHLVQKRLLFPMVVSIWQSEGVYLTKFFKIEKNFGWQNHKTRDEIEKILTHHIIWFICGRLSVNAYRPVLALSIIRIGLSSSAYKFFTSRVRISRRSQHVATLLWSAPYLLAA